MTEPEAGERPIQLPSGAEMLKACIDEATKASTETRAAAHAELDQWLADCEAQGPAVLMSGCSGDIGKFRLDAYVDDEDGITLAVARCIHRGLP